MAVNKYYEALRALVGRMRDDEEGNREVLKAQRALEVAWRVMEGNFSERKEKEGGLFIEW